MNKPNFQNYKFHPSGLKNLMTQPRSKADRESGELSETTKTYLRELWIKEVFGREKVIKSAPMDKGTAVETHSLSLLQEVSGETYFKNKETLENDYLVGTPDVVSQKKGLVIDIKSSWDIWTFSGVTETEAIKDYGWQLAGYSYLTGITNVSLVYALVDTPEYIITDQLYRLSFSQPPDTDMDQFRKNFVFDDVPKEMRIKRFDVPVDSEKFSEIESAVQKARAFMQGITL